MDLHPRQLMRIAVLGVVTAIGLNILIGTASTGVGLAVAVAAIAVLVGSYALTLLLTVRAGLRRARGLGDEAASEPVRRYARVHFPIMVVMPLMIAAAHPWGTASIAVALGVLVVCQFLFLHALIVTGFVLKRRARTAPPR